MQSTVYLSKPRGALNIWCAVGAGLCFLLFPAYLTAHSADRGFVLLLPTHYYLIGGTLAVLVSVIVVCSIKSGTLDPVFRWRISFRLPVWLSSDVLTQSISLLSTVFFGYLIFQGLFGSTDPLNNPLPLTIWTLWWVIITVSHAMFGNLWLALNPWTGLAKLVAGKNTPPYKLPAWLGYSPAIVAILMFAWFELVSLSPEDPPTLAVAVLAYWLFNLAAILLVGEDQWLRRGEAFAVFFRFISLLSPVTIEPAGKSQRVVFSMPGSRLLNDTMEHWSGAVFILVTLASVSFDGLNKTFWWLAINDVNPLAFAGRSTVMLINSQGLAVAISVMLLLYVSCIWLGWLWSEKSAQLLTMLSQFSLTIIPISLAYHFAHYLTQVLVNGQYLIKVFVNSQWIVTTSFLSNHHSVERLWQLQVAVIVMGHIVSAVLAHLTALKLFSTPESNWTTGQVLRSQLPLGLILVAYTTFGLWLLATPTGV